MELSRSIFSAFLKKMRADYDLRANVDVRVVFSLLLKIQHIKLTKLAKKQLLCGCDQFRFVNADISSMDATTVRLGFLHTAEGMGLLLAARAKGTEGEQHKLQGERQLRVASRELERAYSINPLCGFTLMVWGSCLGHLADHQDDLTKKEAFYAQSCKTLSLCWNNGKKYPPMLKMWARNLRRYANVLIELGEHSRAEELMKQADDREGVQAGNALICTQMQDFMVDL